MEVCQAVVLNIKIKYLETFNEKREEIVKHYNDAFEDIKDIATLKNSCGNVWHQYVLCSSYKDKLGDFLASKSVGSAAFYPVSLHLQKAFFLFNVCSLIKNELKPLENTEFSYQI